MSRRAAFACLLLSALACQKGASTTKAPEPDVPEPEDLLVRVAVASPAAALERVKGYAEAVSPGSGATMEPRLLRQGLAFAVQTPQLDGLDLAKPLHLLLLDPKKFPRPVVLVGGVGDEKQLQAASNVTVEIKDGRAVIGEAAAVKAVAAYGHAVGKVAAPSAPTATLSPGKIVARYRAEIDQGRQSMAATLGAQSPAMGKVIDVEIDLFLRLADQSERMQVVLDAQGGEAMLEMALFPKAGTTFAAFNAAQKPGVETPLLGRLPVVERPSMLLAGRYALGAARAPLLDLMKPLFESLLAKPFDAAMRGRVEAWMDLFDGDVAMLAGSGAGGGMSMVEIFGVSDGKKAQAAIRELTAATIGAGREIDVMGQKTTFATKVAASTVDGVEVDELIMRFDTSTLPPAQQEMMRRMYGADGMHFYVAGFDRYLVATFGADGQAQLPKAIAAARAGGAAAAPPAFAPALAAAGKRGASFAMAIDYAQLLGPMMGATPPPSKSSVAIDFGVTDGAARMRFGVPAEHIKEITAMMGGAR